MLPEELHPHSATPAAASDAPEGAEGGPKGRPAPETLEQLIVEAYETKRRALLRGPRAQQRLAEGPRLTTESLERLAARAGEDATLTVPPRLLLAVEATTLNAIKGPLRQFVLLVLQRHPFFRVLPLGPFITNDPEAVRLVEAIEHARTAVLPETLSLKKHDEETFRANAMLTLALWSAEREGIPKIVEALHLGWWRASADDVRRTPERLDALMDLGPPAGAGLVGDVFRDQAVARLRSIEKLSRDLELARADVLRLQEAGLAAAQRAERLASELDATRAQVVAAEGRVAIAKVHLSHDFEQLRTRMLRRLTEDLQLLDEGLLALQRDPPKVHVMLDYAERVADALRRELRSLKDGGMV